MRTSQSEAVSNKARARAGFACAGVSSTARSSEQERHLVAAVPLIDLIARLGLRSTLVSRDPEAKKGASKTALAPGEAGAVEGGRGGRHERSRCICWQPLELATPLLDGQLEAGDGALRRGGRNGRVFGREPGTNNPQRAHGA